MKIKTTSQVKEFFVDNAPFFSVGATFLTNLVITNVIKKITTNKNYRSFDGRSIFQKMMEVKINDLLNATRKDLLRMIDFERHKLEKVNQESILNKESIENKAKSYLAFTSLAASFTFGAMAFLSEALPTETSIIKNFEIIKWLTLVSIVFLIQGVISALISMSYNYIYVSRECQRLRNGNKKASSLYVARSIVLNDYTNLQRSNFLYLSFISLRNGLLILVVLIFFLFLGIKPNVEVDREQKIFIENLGQATEILRQEVADNSKGVTNLNYSTQEITNQLKQLTETLEEFVSSQMSNTTLENK